MEGGLTLTGASGQHPAGVVGGLGGDELDQPVDGVLGAENGPRAGISLGTQESESHRNHTEITQKSYRNHTEKSHAEITICIVFVIC